jgi:hypothetical protein
MAAGDRRHRVRVLTPEEHEALLLGNLPEESDGDVSVYEEIAEEDLLLPPRTDEAATLEAALQDIAREQAEDKDVAADLEIQGGTKPDGERKMTSAAGCVAKENPWCW